MLLRSAVVLPPGQARVVVFLNFREVGVQRTTAGKMRSLQIQQLVSGVCSSIATRKWSWAKNRNWCFVNGYCGEREIPSMDKCEPYIDCSTLHTSNPTTLCYNRPHRGTDLFSKVSSPSIIFLHSPCRKFPRVLRNTSAVGEASGKIGYLE